MMDPVLLASMLNSDNRDERVEARRAVRNPDRECLPSFPARVLPPPAPSRPR